MVEEGEDVTLPLVYVQRPTPPLTEEELAEHENQHVEVGRNTAYVTGKVCRVCKHQWPCPTTRLVADLRASRERVKELEAKLAWVDERIDSGEL